MAPKKSLVLAAVLVVVAAVGLMVVPHGADAATTASASTSVRISGVVPCSTGSSVGTTAAPVFPNAGLQLVCSGKVVSGATADGAGAFLISLDSVATDMLSVLLGNQCNVVVTTPLAACDASLAGVKGTLTAPLKLVLGGSTGSGSGGLADLGGLIGAVVGLVGGIIGGILQLAAPTFSMIS